MKIKSLFISALSLAVLAALTSADTKAPAFFMAGDSTMANGRDTVKSPARGWGQMFGEFFTGIRVVNCASAGQSSKSFRQPGKDMWTKLISQVHAGDYVFIQFGHNDPKPDTVRHTEPDEFAANLIRYISDVRAKKAIPVLATSIERRIYETDGTLRNTHAGYVEKYYEVSEATGVPVIDLHRLTRKLLLAYPPEETKKFFMWVAPGSGWEMFPDGNQDNTHLNILGGRVVAGMAAVELVKIYPDLRPYVNDIEEMVYADASFAEVREAIDRVYSIK